MYPSPEAETGMQVKLLAFGELLQDAGLFISRSAKIGEPVDKHAQEHKFPATHGGRQ